MPKNREHDHSKYPILAEIMNSAHISCWDIANSIRQSPYIAQKKLSGEIDLSMWEKVKIKCLVKSNLPLEQLFLV